MDNAPTTVNPQDTARVVARILLITEAHPFIPQAQGTRFGFSWLIFVSPRGKGIPIKKARGAISPNEISIFVQSGKLIVCKKNFLNPTK